MWPSEGRDGRKVRGGRRREGREGRGRQKRGGEGRGRGSGMRGPQASRCSALAKDGPGYKNISISFQGNMP